MVCILADKEFAYHSCKILSASLLMCILDECLERLEEMFTILFVIFNLHDKFDLKYETISNQTDQISKQKFSIQL